MNKWKPIKNYEGIYDVSSDGDVRRLRRVVTCGRTTGIRELKEKLVSQFKANSGTGIMMVQLFKNGKKKTFSVDKLVREHFND